MTVSLYLASITNAIAAISVSGVTIKDKDEVAAAWLSTPNVLYPHLDDFVTNFEVRFDSLMQGADAPITIAYTLNYRFLSTLVGDAATVPVAYSLLVDKVILIVNALIAVPGPYSGKVQMVMGNLSLGPRDDPSGNQYFGTDFALQIEEMQN